VIAEGTSDELKAQIGGERLAITVARGSNLDIARRTLTPYGDGELYMDAERRTILVPVTNGARLLADIVRDLDTAGVHLDDFGLRRPTMDDVFLTLTGHAAEADARGDHPTPVSEEEAA
jgi:ABC-2 type transport system ATP-binding protein